MCEEVDGVAGRHLNHLVGGTGLMECWALCPWLGPMLTRRLIWMQDCESYVRCLVGDGINCIVRGRWPADAGGSRKASTPSIFLGNWK